MTQRHILTASQAFAAAAEFAKNGQFEQAEMLYRAALTSEPHQFEGLHSLGLLLLDRNRLQEAEDFLSGRG